MVVGTHAGSTARRHAHRLAAPGRGAGRSLLATVLAVATLLWLGQAQAQTLEASVDRNAVGQGESVELVLRYPGQNPDGEPDLKPLEQDFQVLSTGRSSRINIVNGQMNASTEWHVQLTPKHSGTLTIPAIALGSTRSQPLTITVSQGQAGQAGSGAGGNVFIETSVAPQSPYVQGQIVYTARIFHAVQLRNASLTDPKVDDAIIQRLGDDVSYQTQRDGHHYEVIERRYAVFPQHSGDLSIDAPVLSAEVLDRRHRGSGVDELFNNFPGGADPFGGLFAATRPVRTSAPSVAVTVRPRPDGSGSGPWLPAQNLSVSEAWSPDPPKFRVGEPVTRTITVLARGLTAAQLPNVPLGPDGDIKVYPDQPALETTSQANIVLGKRVMKAALVPGRAGTLTLPEVRIPWWDTETDKQKVAVLPARTIEVLPAAGQTATPPPPAPTPAPTPSQQTTAVPAPTAPPPVVAARPGVTPAATRQTWWPWLSAVLAAGWLVTLGLWAWERRRRGAPRAGATAPPAPDLRPAERELQAACRSGVAARVRSALLAWGAARWPDSPPRSLGALSRRVDDPTAAASIQGLDRMLYAGSTDSWTGGAELLHALRPVLRGGGRSAAGSDVPLPELYAGT
jgi:hypothetical protein